eukprot:11218-Prymnesium_polylepis.1
MTRRPQPPRADGAVRRAAVDEAGAARVQAEHCAPNAAGGRALGRGGRTAQEQGERAQFGKQFGRGGRFVPGAPPSSVCDSTSAPLWLAVAGGGRGVKPLLPPPRGVSRGVLRGVPPRAP